MGHNEIQFCEDHGHCICGNDCMAPAKRPLSQWRDSQGFGRPEQVGPGVWSTTGPDNEDHAIRCAFIEKQGILPCTCDHTRKTHSWWWQCWFRWLQVSARPQAREGVTPWPIEGPDHGPWVPGVDFNDS